MRIISSTSIIPGTAVPSRPFSAATLAAASLAAAAAAICLGAAALAGCGGGGGTSVMVDPAPSPSASASPSASVPGRLLTVYPGEGPAAGGTSVSLRTENIDWSRFPRYKVMFGGSEASNVSRSAPSGGFTYVTCTTPAGSGSVKPSIVFLDAAGAQIGTLSAVELGADTFTYR